MASGRATTVSVNTTSEYWGRAREPLASLIFLAPLLVLYEVGVLFVGGRAPDTVRNGADFWMREALARAGLKEIWLLPVLVAGLLLLWHVAGKYKWRLSADTLVGMLAESLLFAFLLIVIGQFQGVAFDRMGANVRLAAGLQSITAPIVTFTGAGLYEEVLFRLCLLPICFVVFRGLRFSSSWSSALAVVATSLLFSAAHYVGSEAYEF